MKKLFLELEKIIEYSFVDNSFECTSISNNSFICISSLSTLNKWYMLVIIDINKNSVICVNIDYV